MFKQMCFLSPLLGVPQVSRAVASVQAAADAQLGAAKAREEALADQLRAATAVHAQAAEEWEG